MLVAEPAYEGASGRTRVERRGYVCRCGARFAVELLRAVDAVADPAEARRLLDGSANRARCARCGADEPLAVTVVFHDPSRALLSLLIPDGMRHRELEELGRLYLRLAGDGAAVPRYVRELRVALGLDELRAIAGEPSSPVATAPAVEPVTDPHRELPLGLVAGGSGGVPLAEAPTPVPPVHAAPSTATPTQLAVATAPPADAVFEEATRARVAIPEARAAAVERWVAHREPATTLAIDDEILHLVALPRSESAPFVEAPLELRVQLHRMPSYPLVVLTLLGAPAGGNRPRALHALLEIGRAAHRIVLERLARRAAVTLELFTPEYLPLARHVVAAPLENNVTRLFAGAREALKRIPSGQRDFEGARRAFLAPDYDRLGRVEPEFEATRGGLDGPRAVRRAVAEISRWSEAGAEAYLIEIRSFPAGAWSELRARVARRALDLGVHVRRSIIERALSEAQVAAAWPDVLQRQLQAFAAVVSGRRPNDLQPDEEMENWRLLFGECKSAGVVADPEVRALAAARSSRPPARQPPHPEEPALEQPVFDAVRTPTPELLSLLERRELRREVALALCERRDPVALAPLFHVLPKMTRAEVSRVLPALVAGYGDTAIPLLVDGLRSRKSYLRQGCALGLGTLGRAQSIEPLLELLRTEPTEVWREVARALGDLGAPVVPAIGQRLRTLGSASAPGSDPLADEVRERLLRALAHAAGRGERQAVERLGASPDPLVAEPARRALAILDEVRRADREVRVEAPRDQTVVRAFSRRFFEVLGEDAELADLDPQEVAEADGATGDQPAEVDEDAEPLDDADLVEEPAAHAVVSRSDTTQPRLILPRDRGT